MSHDGVMIGSRRVIILGMLAVGGLGLAGVGVFFLHIGLADANQWAGVLGLFVGLAGLVLSGYGVWLARRAPGASNAPQRSSVLPEQSVSGSVGGDNVQIGSAQDVTIGRGPSEL